MNSIAVLCFAILVAAAVARPEEKYTSKYDYLDIAEILSNPRLLLPFIKCALEQGKCSAEGKELKGHIKEALENNCAKCTDRQRTGVRQVIGHLINKEPDYWTALSTKYDPTHKYMKQYEDQLRVIAA